MENNNDLLDEIEVECDHDWEFVDDSFDHDWAGGGTEVIRYWECSNCGETKSCDRDLSDY